MYRNIDQGFDLLGSLVGAAHPAADGENNGFLRPIFFSLMNGLNKSGRRRLRGRWVDRVRDKTFIKRCWFDVYLVTEFFGSPDDHQRYYADTVLPELGLREIARAVGN